MAFHVTSAAARELLEAALRSDAEGMALRVAAKAAPQGIDFGMGFDEEAPGDEVADFDGLTVLIAANSRLLLADRVLDFVELEGGGRDFILTDSAGQGCATEPRGCGGCSHGACGSRDTT